MHGHWLPESGGGGGSRATVSLVHWTPHTRLQSWGDPPNKPEKPCSGAPSRSPLLFQWPPFLQ